MTNLPTTTNLPWYFQLTIVFCIKFYNEKLSLWNLIYTFWLNANLVPAVNPSRYFIHRIEKYRPQSLNELISHEEIISTSKCCRLKFQHTHTHQPTTNWIKCSRNTVIVVITINFRTFFFVCSFEIHWTKSIATFAVLWPARNR